MTKNLETMDHDEYDVVIYHANCYDGLTAAWVARKHSPQAEFIAARHGDPPPDVFGKRVLVVDFAWSKEQMLTMMEQAEDILVLDHHIKAYREIGDLPFVVFDMERSGAGLAWDVLMRGQERPFLVEYVEDRDLARYQYRYTRAYHAAMCCSPLTFKSLDDIHAKPFGDAISQGEAVLPFIDNLVDKVISRSVRGTWEGHLCVAVNSPIEIFDDVAGKLLSEPQNKDAVILGWFWDPDPVCLPGRPGRPPYACSFRSNKGSVDVCALAERFGGGGHTHASACRMRVHPKPLYLRGDLLLADPT